MSLAIAFLERPSLEGFASSAMAGVQSPASSSVPPVFNGKLPSLVRARLERRDDGDDVPSRREGSDNTTRGLRFPALQTTEPEPLSGNVKKPMYFEVGLVMEEGIRYRLSLEEGNDDSSTIGWCETDLDRIRRDGGFVSLMRRRHAIKLLDIPLNVHPDRANDYEDAVVRAFRFLRDGGEAIYAVETIANFAHSSRISHEFLTRRMERLASRRNRCAQLAQETLASHSLFADATEAGLYGNKCVRVTVHGIRNLKQTQRSASGKPSSPFVTLAIGNPILKTLGAAGEGERAVGRTNTEYRTRDPVFGSNARVRECEHAVPRTTFEAARFGRLIPPSTSQFGDRNVPQFESYAVVEEEELIFRVFHERFSVNAGGIQRVYMTETRVRLGKIDVSSPQLALPLDDGEGILLVTIAILANDVGEDDNVPSANPFSQGTILPPERRAVLTRVPPRFIRSHLAALDAGMMILEEMRSQLAKWMVEGINFKSSQRKKEFALGAAPTNLHQGRFDVICEMDESENEKTTTVSSYYLTTIGAPAAHVLGLGEGKRGLRTLTERLRGESLPLASSAADTRAPLPYFEHEWPDSVGVEMARVICTPFDRGVDYRRGNDALIKCSNPAVDMDDVCIRHARSWANSPRESSDPKNAARSTPLPSATVTTLGRSALASITARFVTTVPSNRQGGDEADGDHVVVMTGTSLGNSMGNGREPPWQARMTLEAEHFVRASVVVSQALPAVCSAFLCACATAPAGTGRRVWARGGFLIGWASLLSTYAKEAVMLDDLCGAATYLSHHVRLVVMRDESETPAVEILEETGAGVSPWHATYVIRVRISPARHEALFGNGAAITGGEGAQHGKKTVEFPLVVVLVSQGVNEEQSMAIVRSGTGVQRELNAEAARRLRGYWLSCLEEGTSSRDEPPPALSRFEAVVSAQRDDQKDVQLLLLFDDCVRSLGGSRVGGCKSAKDRQGMVATLEEARWLGGLDTARAAGTLREFGVRREVCLKNIGRRQYAFNALQRLALPIDLRPPPATITSMAHSIANNET